MTRRELFGRVLSLMGALRLGAFSSPQVDGMSGQMLVNDGAGKAFYTTLTVTGDPVFWPVVVDHRWSDGTFGWDQSYIERLAAIRDH